MTTPSFDNSKNKLETLWNLTEDNENEVNNLKKITIKFQPKAFKKNIIIIPIVENLSMTDDLGGEGEGG